MLSASPEAAERNRKLPESWKQMKMSDTEPDARPWILDLSPVGQLHTDAATRGRYKPDRLHTNIPTQATMEIVLRIAASLACPISKKTD